MKNDLLLEIGTEELPVSIFPEILSQMKNRLQQLLDLHNLKPEKIKTTATPRRLVAIVQGLPERQPDRFNEVIGPPYRVAFDTEGQPTKAAYGFAQRQGVDVKELSIVNTEKGQYVAVKTLQPGKPAKEVLAQVLPEYILSLSFPKSMRWGYSKLRFARPIHWILAIFQGEVIPFSLDGLKSGMITYGHRFSDSGPIVISDSNNYIELLEKAYVIVDYRRRQALIEEQLNNIAAEVQGEVVWDKDLLNWVVFLTEYPIVVKGRFSEDFLRLPEPVLITVMKQHQKYFALKSKDRLLPMFAAVINTPVKDVGLVRTGLERVLRARLQDAQFFYQSDLKRPLAERVELLKGVIFQAKLGTIWDKVQRLQTICQRLPVPLSEAERSQLLRAAWLCKADLTTEMVNEFPELQGVMGGIYAQKQGEPLAVAQAISEHYLPVEAGGELPQSLLGCLLSLADKIDSIVGCFGVGLVPTGNSDPFALRRQAIGILRILKEKEVPIRLDDLIEIGMASYPKEFDFSDLKPRLLEFFKNRLSQMLKDEGHSHAVTKAVLGVFDGDVPQLFAKASALSFFEKRPEFVPLVIAYKRVNRIIEKASSGLPQPELFQQDQERALYEKSLEIANELERHLAQKDYIAAFEALLRLKPYIDDFFDHVLVMTDDDRLRNNRLSLLTQVQRLFLKLADLSQIPI